MLDRLLSLSQSRGSGDAGMPGPQAGGMRVMMDDGMMGTSMMWGMGLAGLLVLVLVVLAIAALVKYLFRRGP